MPDNVNGDGEAPYIKPNALLASGSLFGSASEEEDEEEQRGGRGGGSGGGARTDALALEFDGDKSDHASSSEDEHGSMQLVPAAAKQEKQEKGGGGGMAGMAGLGGVNQSGSSEEESEEDDFDDMP